MLGLKKRDQRSNIEDNANTILMINKERDFSIDSTKLHIIENVLNTK